MPSWDSLHTNVSDYGKLLDRAEGAKRAFDAGEIKSWDLDGIVTELKPKIEAKRKYIAEVELYLWSRTGCMETVVEWRARTKDWRNSFEFSRAKFEYYSRPRRAERARQEAIAAEIAYEKKIEREAKKAAA